jgi:hypothetical protein
MTDRIKPPVILRFPERVPHEVDRLLRDYFRAEMPEPWPALRPPEVKASRPTLAGPRRGSAWRRRLVLAASVGFLLVGYLVLAQAFPGSSGGPGLHFNPQENSAKLPSLPRKSPLQPLRTQTVPTRNGGQARMWEQWVPGRRLPIITVQDLEPPAKRP